MSTKLDAENISSYKEDLEKDMQQIETELNSINITLNSITKPQISKIEILFTECNNNIRHIEVELSLLPQKTKDKYFAELKTFTDKLAKLKRNFNELRLSRNKIDKTEKNARKEVDSKLLKTSENLDDGTAMLGESIRTMIGVNATDKDTKLVLHRQTGVIKGATEKINDADSYVMRSEKVIRNMMNKVFTNKIVLFAMVVLLALINSFLIYIKIKYNILGFKK